MEEALGADGHGFLEQHDALIGLVAEELQGGEAARRRHVEMLPAARGHDKAVCCAHVGVLPCGGMRINVGTMNINVHESRTSRLDLPALAAKSSAETPRKACWEARSEAIRREISSPAVAPRHPRRPSALVVLVVAAPPEARLVAPLGCAVEPLVHAPEAVHSARIGGIGVVDHAVLERERAQARPLARVRGHVGSGRGREGDRPLAAGFRDQRRLAPVIVFDAPLALLLLGEPDVEVEVEVAAERGRPWKRPPIRRLYACSFANGARDTAQSVTSWLARCTANPLKPSAIAEQDGHPAL